MAQPKSQLANSRFRRRCFVVAELPRNTMGKVQKNLLRDQYKGCLLMVEADIQNPPWRALISSNIGMHPSAKF